MMLTIGDFSRLGRAVARYDHAAGLLVPMRAALLLTYLAVRPRRSEKDGSRPHSGVGARGGVAARARPDSGDIAAHPRHAAARRGPAPWPLLERRRRPRRPRRPRHASPARSRSRRARRQRHQDVHRRCRAAPGRAGSARPRRAHRALPPRHVHDAARARRLPTRPHHGAPAVATNIRPLRLRRDGRLRRRSAGRARAPLVASGAGALRPDARAAVWPARRGLPLLRHRLHSARRDHRAGQRPAARCSASTGSVSPTRTWKRSNRRRPASRRALTNITRAWTSRASTPRSTSTAGAAWSRLWPT